MILDWLENPWLRSGCLLFVFTPLENEYNGNPDREGHDSDTDQFSQEDKKWGGGHGVFTYFLVKGLGGEADYNSDGRVTLGEIIPYLSESVRRETHSAQSPTVAGRFDPAMSIGK